MNLLSRREHSRHELLQKLSRKEYEEEDVLQAVERLAEQGLQSDQRFAESFTRQRADNGNGPVKIRHELQQRGVAEHLALAALAEHAGTWLQSAIDLQQRKYGALPVDYKTRAKQQRFLQGRGFDFDVINRVFSE